jgi:hypothetical protein
MLEMAHDVGHLVRPQGEQGHQGSPAHHRIDDPIGQGARGCPSRVRTRRRPASGMPEGPSAPRRSPAFAAA